MKKMHFLLLLMLLPVLVATAQTGSLRGTVTDENTGETMMGTNVLLKNAQDSLIMGALTDFEAGFYQFNNVPPGIYRLEVQFIGYSKKVIDNVAITSGQVTTLNVSMQEDIAILESVVIMQAGVVETKPISSKEIAVHGIISNKSKHALPTKRYKSKQKSINIEAPDNEGPILPPTTTGKDTTIENAPVFVEKERFSTFSIDVDKANYSLLRREIQRHNIEISPNDIRIEELINYFNYDYPAPANEHPLAIQTEFTDCPWNADTRLLRIGMQGIKVDYSDLPPANYVFLLDVSGSMSSSLNLLKQSMNLLIDQLRTQDKVAIVVYAGAAGLVLPATSGDKKDKIRDALNNLQAGGSTAGGEGIRLAYSVARNNFMPKGNNRVILVTDGDFNVGVSSAEGLQKLIETERKKGVFLTVLGMGGGNYQDHEMEILADKGNGNYFFIDGIEEANKVLTKEICGTLHTVAKDVKLQLEFNPKAVRAYRLVGYENRILDKKDFNNDAKDAGELGAGHCVTALYEIVLQPSVPDTASMLTLRFRYKKPDANHSQLLQQNVTCQHTPWASVSNNTAWAATVAAWGQMLRGSIYLRGITADDIMKMANEYANAQPDKERADFVELVDTWQRLLGVK